MDNDTKQQLQTLKKENKKLLAQAKKLERERDKALKAAEATKSSMSHNNVAMEWLNDYEASGQNLAYSPLGWLMYNPDEGVWKPPDLGKIRRQLKDTFLINGKHSVTTRDINSAIGLAADQVSRQGPSDWNNNQDIIICKTNNLNLDTMEISEHDHKLYATSKLNADYNPDILQDEQGLEWLKIIDMLFKGRADFIQEFIGYSLTTSTAHDTSIWLQSPAGGGKSTFLRAVGSMMGGRCGGLNLSLLNKKGEESLAVIIGKTLLIAEEVGGRSGLERADLLKQIIDGGDVSVKQMRKDPINVKSYCKVLWAMNRIPTIFDQDGSVDRRVKIVNMQAIPPKDRDPKVRQRAEGGFYNDAVLAWAVEGLKRLRERGRFDVPDDIKNNSLTQIKSFDLEEQFIKERCIHIPNFWIETSNRRGAGLCEQSKDLQVAYNSHYEELGHKFRKSAGNLRQDWLRLLGSDRVMEKRNRVYYLDVKIIPVGMDDDYFNNEVDFIKANLTLDEGGEVNADYLHGLYTSFCAENGHEANVDKLLRVLGWADVKINTKGCYEKIIITD